MLEETEDAGRGRFMSELEGTDDTQEVWLMSEQKTEDSGTRADCRPESGDSGTVIPVSLHLEACSVAGINPKPETPEPLKPNP